MRYIEWEYKVPTPKCFIWLFRFRFKNFWRSIQISTPKEWEEIPTAIPTDFSNVDLVSPWCLCDFARFYNHRIILFGWKNYPLKNKNRSKDRKLLISSLSVKRRFTTVRYLNIFESRMKWLPRIRDVRSWKKWKYIWNIPFYNICSCVLIHS